jgi:hypothetical protein
VIIANQQIDRESHRHCGGAAGAEGISIRYDTDRRWR